jgi:hypothetical protein
VPVFAVPAYDCRLLSDVPIVILLLTPDDDRPIFGFCVISGLVRSSSPPPFPFMCAYCAYCAFDISKYPPYPYWEVLVCGDVMGVMGVASGLVPVPSCQLAMEPVSSRSKSNTEAPSADGLSMGSPRGWCGWA